MKLKGIISASVLTLSAVVSAPTFACSSGNDSLVENVLSSQPNGVTDLGCGKYEFAGLHADQNSEFSDRWKLYVSEDMVVSLSIFDLELNLDESNENYGSEKIFDTKNMSFTIFDNYSGNFLGWAHENETLSGVHLLAGQSYTLKVFGEVGGLFGSTYHGTLETCVTEVPLGDTAPLLGSALGLLALRLRKRTAAV